MKLEFDKLKRYETIFILDGSDSESGGNKFKENLKALVDELGGEILETNDMGQRQLAHPIRKKSTGYYLGLIVSLSQNKVKEFKDKFRLDSSVLRLEIFSYTDPPKAIKSEPLNQSD